MTTDSWAKKQCDKQKLQGWADDILMVGGLFWLVISLSGSVDKFGSFMSFMDGKGMKDATRVFGLVAGLAGLYVASCRLMYPLGKKGDACKAGCDCSSGKCSGDKCE